MDRNNSGVLIRICEHRELIFNYHLSTFNYRKYLYYNNRLQTSESMYIRLNSIKVRKKGEKRDEREGGAKAKWPHMLDSYALCTPFTKRVHVHPSFLSIWTPLPQCTNTQTHSLTKHIISSVLYTHFFFKLL